MIPKSLSNLTPRTTMLMLTLLLLLSPGVFNGAIASAERGYSFGVFPYLSAARLEPIYVPLGIEMGQALDRDVKFGTSTQFNKFFARLEKQSFDIALIQPFWYPAAVDRFNYLPLARFDEPLTSSIMVLDGSPIKNVADLRDKIIATPPAFVPVVHMARRELRTRGLNPDQDLELKAFRTVDSCFQQVVIGNATGCVAPHFAQTVIEQKLGISLRTVLKTPSIPNLSFVVHSRVPAEERAKLKKMLLSWGDDEDERELLQLMNTRRLVPAEDQEYDTVRDFIRQINVSGN